MSVDIYDVETYNEAFILCAKDRDTLIKKHFEISQRKDDTQQLIQYLNEIEGQIGYNVINFDYPVLHWILNNYKKYTQYTFSQAICEKAQEIIGKEYSAIKPKYVKIPQLDLFKIWHYDNKNKATSLKYLEFAMQMDNIQDLPFGVYDTLTSEMIDKIIKYCYHDVDATYKFYKITVGDTNNILYKGKNQIEFRKEMGNKFNTNFLNSSDVKIGEEINKLTYLSLTGKTWWDIKGKKTYRGMIPVSKLIPSYINFKAIELQQLNDYLLTKEINCFNPKLEYIFKFANNTWKVALGGIHTEDSARIVTPKSNQRFNERDVGSMYPNKIITAIHPDFKTEGLYPAHLGIEWLVGYKGNKDERLRIKSLHNKNSEQIQEVDVRKLALNGGGYGKTGEETNWQFDPLVKYTTTIQCQLDILLLADELWDTGVVQIESGNTDGINILYDDEHDELIESICKKWEETTSASLETTEYSKVIRTSVNDYMAIKPDGKIKRKGDFEIDKELHKNHSQKIVPLAIDNYFINGILPEETIKNHTDIFDFCKAVKGIKGATFITRDWINRKIVEYPQQKKVNRYIVTTDGCQLIKILPPLKDDNGNFKRDKLAKYKRENPTQLNMFDFVPDVVQSVNREFEVEAKYKVQILNKIESKDIKDYNINYQYYIDECYKIINQIK